VWLLRVACYCPHVMRVAWHQDLLLLLLLCVGACACRDLPYAAVQGANQYAVACFVMIQTAHNWRLVTACSSIWSVGVRLDPLRKEHTRLALPLPLPCCAGFTSVVCTCGTTILALLCVFMHPVAWTLHRLDVL
jgi:hypothetical protein